jgi:hypothetical protein
MTRTFPPLLRWSARLLLCLGLELGILLVADTLHLQLKPTSQPTISDAELQEAKNWLGVNFTPEELASIEITDEMRDRLRQDPRAQPLLKILHKDLISIRSGGDTGNPIWVTYGAKSFPLLDYYTQSADPIRQRYGITGIRRLGKPYTTLWLKRQIKRRAPSNDLLRNTEDWSEFGLDDPQTKAEIIQLTRQNLAPQRDSASNYDDPYYYEKSGQFNRRLLNSLLSREELDQEYKRENQNFYQSDHAESVQFEREQQKIEQWAKWVKRSDLTAANIQSTLPEFDKQSPRVQLNLVLGIAYVKQGKLAAPGRSLLRHVMQDPRSPNYAMAVVILDFHGDPEATGRIYEVLNGDLHKLYPVARSLVANSMGLVLLRILQKYPDSRFVRGFQDYGDLTGHSYYGNVPRNEAILRRIEQKKSAQTAADWQDWLNRYPDHPGADDATERLALSLLQDDQPVAASREWIKLMTQRIGDGDARFRGYRRLRVMLDIGLTTAQLQTLLDDPLLDDPNAAKIIPLMRYALAVHFARDQDYASALQVSNGVNLAKIPYRILRNYSFLNDEPDDTYYRDYLKQSPSQMQALLTEQRQRWQQLNQWQQQNTAAARYAIASHWTDQGGWKNGYFGMWIGIRRGERWNHLPMGSWYEEYQPSKNIQDRFECNRADFYECYELQTCDLVKRKTVANRDAYQKGNSNTVALSLYEALLRDPKTPATIQEKTLYMEGITLAAQKLYFEPNEAEAIHPPPGVIAGPKIRVPYYEGSDQFDLELDILGDYQRRIDRLISQMQKQVPNSRYTDDLLMANYYLTGSKRYLKQVVNQYPKSDRADEARFLLNTKEAKNE